MLHSLRNFKRIPQLLKSYYISLYPCLLNKKLSRASFQSSECGILKSRLLPWRFPTCFYSSPANEGQAEKKHPDFIITVPSIEFDDVEFEQSVSHSDLCDALQVCNSFEEQMFVLTSTLVLSREDVEKRFRFSKVIESFLQPFFGKLKIQMFGSTVNGFGFKGCDIDMSFETFADPKEQISYLENPDVPLVSEVMCGKVMPEELCLLPRKEQLLFIHTLLLEFYKGSADPAIYINAHVPLVRFYHDNFNLKCDLSCSNKVAFANTKLLYLFAKLDDRVIPLMVAIRYWAKHVELIGRGLLFNTYTISLLVIHFLQTRNPPILPSAEHILSLSDSITLDDMNDQSFLDIKKSIPPSENAQMLAELLSEFFFYYLYFDFTRVICPLIGGSIPRDKFFSNLPSRKFKMNTICVQDPMLESHNVADLVDYKTCKKLFREIMIATKILQNSSNLSPSSCKWGILKLLDRPEEIAQQINILQKNDPFPVPFLKIPIIAEFESNNSRLMTAQSLLYLIEHILLIECSVREKSDVVDLLKNHDVMVEKQRKIAESVNQKAKELQEFTKRMRFRDNYQKIEKFQADDMPMLEEFEKFNSEHTLILLAECKVTKNTWLGRDSDETLPIVSSNDFIERERHVSLHAAKQNDMNSVEGKSELFRFFYECYVSQNEPDSEILINLRPYQRTNFNPILAIFLKDYIPKLINVLNEH